ncbi:hypothetical protein [Halogeometricum sp. CBA1124]|uniref:Gfo/Idh/MocA family protein n=1 Tax=Halogeometricum sp. CBA1124 TaxID=2668071 RepID=UPI0014296D3D|nr:hypothetical protein [Halogeometricum sp. CBA1124]MUV56967.1 hypothetical protein [Halogeometricum sp. CBA1124]
MGGGALAAPVLPTVRTTSLGRRDGQHRRRRRGASQTDRAVRRRRLERVVRRVRAVESFEDALCAVVAHDVDVFEWTFGSVERAFARAREGDRCDHVHAVLAFREGGRGTVETTWYADSPPAPRVEVEYSGSHGRLDFDDSDVSSTLHAAGTPVDVDPPEDDCRGRCLHQFVESLRGGDRPPAGVEPMGPSRVAVAMRQSIAAGEPRTLAEASR